MKLNEFINSIKENCSVNTCDFDKAYSCEIDGNKLEYHTFYLMDKTKNNYEELGNYKYCMIPYLKPDSEISNATIVVGQNPSTSSKSGIDKTNLNIFKTLYHIKDDFNFYIMLNTFPIIDPNGKSVSDTNYADTNNLITKYIINLLVEAKISVEIILSCSKANKVYLPFLEKLFEIIKVNKIPLKCFCYDGNPSGIQHHMSIQSCNIQKRNKKCNFCLKDLEFPKISNDKFGKIIFTLIEE